MHQLKLEYEELLMFPIYDQNSKKGNHETNRNKNQILKA